MLFSSLSCPSAGRPWTVTQVMEFRVRGPVCSAIGESGQWTATSCSGCSERRERRVEIAVPLLTLVSLTL